MTQEARDRLTPCSTHPLSVSLPFPGKVLECVTYFSCRVSLFNRVCFILFGGKQVSGLTAQAETLSPLALKLSSHQTAN